MNKIIAVDIDGTLLNSNHQLTDVTKNSLIKAQENGNIVVIASGRDPKGVESYAKALKLDEFGGLISNYNGCRITNFKTKEIIINHSLDDTLLKEYINFTKNFDAPFLIYLDGKIFTNKKNSKIAEFSAWINKMDLVVKEDILDNIDYKLNNIILSHESKEILDKFETPIREKFANSLEIVRSTDNYLEAMPKGFDKGTSLIEIAKYYDYDIKDIIAFGDERNDIGMIKDAGVGVAMGNAHPIIKKLADYITLTNDEDGIAYYLEKFKLI
ncbi:MAG: Cof-type HAD-IIB family hydrolase [Peptoniphilaceae bacterium]|nr:Cof-type HAD-IIB family hydrolase [Peptoniphilaceae bacterium]MDY6018868.1 Cof-type HAD-IIB family hydrolase [Anaerococcus sp.]